MPVYWRADLAPGAALDGPALIGEDETTILVPAGLQRQGRRPGPCLARAQAAEGLRMTGATIERAEALPSSAGR